MKSQGRIQLDALTGLRFLTAYHIVMFHHGEEGLAWLPTWLYNILAGPGGVGLFFVLSGFILTYVYSKGFETRHTGKGAFWLARVARVYPTYLLGLALMAPFFFPPFFDSGSFISGLSKLMATVIPTLLLLQVWIPPIALSWNGPDWAVAAMFFFYLVFPFFIAYLSKWPLQRLYTLSAFLIALTIIPAATVLQFPVPDIAWQEGLRTLPFIRLPEFLVGVCLGKLYLTRRQATAVAEFKGSLFTNLGAVITLLVMGIGLAMPYFVYKPLLVLGFGLLIYGLAYGDGVIARLLSQRAMVLLGHAGFPIYIFSLPIWGWCNRLMRQTGFLETSPFTFFVFYSFVLISFSLAVLLYYENPLRLAIKRLTNRQAATPAITGD